MNILYINDFDESRNSSNYMMIKKFFDTANVLNFNFNYNNSPNKILDRINSIILNDKIDLVIGNSLGAFFVLKANSCSCCKIVINPSMIPSVDFYHYFSKPLINSYEQLENTRFDKTYKALFGIFGTNDERFSHIKKFQRELCKHIFKTDDYHDITNSSLYRGLKKYVEMGKIKPKNKVDGNQEEF